MASSFCWTQSTPAWMRIPFPGGSISITARLKVSIAWWRTWKYGTMGAIVSRQWTPIASRPMRRTKRCWRGCWRMAENGSELANGVEVALAEIFEFRIPFELIGAQQGSRIRLRFSIWHEHLPVDSLPLEGWIDLLALPEEELESNLYSVTHQG